MHVCARRKGRKQEEKTDFGAWKREHTEIENWGQMDKEKVTHRTGTEGGKPKKKVFFI